MFGRKKPQSQPASLRPSGGQSDELSVILHALGTKFGLNLMDTGQGYIFSPKLWDDPVCNRMLSEQGLQSNMRGNMLMLFKDAASVQKLRQAPECAPARQALDNAGFGFVTYDASASNGFSDELTAMQIEAIQGFSNEYAANAEARKMAVWDFLRFSTELFKGRAAA